MSFGAVKFLLFVRLASNIQDQQMFAFFRRSFVNIKQVLPFASSSPGHHDAAQRQDKNHKEQQSESSIGHTTLSDKSSNKSASEENSARSRKSKPGTPKRPAPQIQKRVKASKYQRLARTVLVLLVPGADEIEFTIAVHLLRRAEIKVVVAGLNGPEPVHCLRDVLIVPDESLQKVQNDNFDVIVLPGGMIAAKHMSDSELLGNMLRRQEEEGRVLAAICTAPTVFAAHKVGYGKCLTSSALVKHKLQEHYHYVDNQDVVVDNGLLTCRGTGSAFDFALKIAEVVCGYDKANELLTALLAA